jgi:hypothetical protein
MGAAMAFALPRDLQQRIETADPTGVPASAMVAVVLVLLLLAVFSMALQWSVDGIGQVQVATAQE